MVPNSGQLDCCMYLYYIPDGRIQFNSIQSTRGHSREEGMMVISEITWVGKGGREGGREETDRTYDAGLQGLVLGECHGVMNIHA